MKKLLLLLTALTALVFTGCELTVTVEENLSVSTTTTSVTLDQGGEDSLKVTVDGVQDTLTSVTYSVANSQVDVSDDVTLSYAMDYINEEAMVYLEVASDCAPGTYTVTVTFAADGKTDSITFTLVVNQTAVALTATDLTLYNPYAADGYNSAYNLVSGTPVAAGGMDGLKMVYAASDSLVADIALDNSLDIRATTTVTELTSINGGMFALATAADYDNATDVSLKVLAASKSFTDNEAIDFATGDVYVMKLDGTRGYVILKIGAIDHTDTAGSTGNTGSIAISYKYVSM